MNTELITDIWNVAICPRSCGLGHFCRYDTALAWVPQGISNKEGIAANDLDLFVVEIGSIAFFNYTTDERDIGVFI